MSQSPRVKSHLDVLGPKVEIANKRIDPDREASALLSQLGRRIQDKLPDGTFHYQGTFATHIYVNEFGKEIRFAHQHVFESTPSEGVISTAIADASVHLMEVVFGRKKPGTLNPKDQRGKKEL